VEIGLLELHRILHPLETLQNKKEVFVILKNRRHDVREKRQ